MLSPMQSLVGASALDITSILRALILFRQAKDKNLVQRSVERWMVAPDSSHSSHSSLENPASVFRFALEILYRLHLVNKEGKPIGVSGLVAHTFGVFPANFAFAYLVLVGELDKICVPFGPNVNSSSAEKDRSAKLLLHIMSFLVGRVPAKKDVKSLPPLPENIVEVLAKYNELCINCALDCAGVIPNCEDLPVPVVDITTPASRINSYAYDFFQHKSLHNLMQSNKLSDNGAYRLLKNFNSILRKFSTAVNKGVTDSKVSAFARAMSYISTQFDKAFDDIEY